MLDVYFLSRKQNEVCTCKIHRIDLTARQHRKKLTSLNY